jgi:hypothetical protein
MVQTLDFIFILFYFLKKQNPFFKIKKRELQSFFFNKKKNNIFSDFHLFSFFYSLRSV